MEKLDKSEKVANVILRWINAFIDENDGYSNFTKDNIVECGISHNLVKKYTTILETNGDIINCTINGYCPRYKVVTKLPCYKFLIGKELTMDQKIFILQVMDKLNGDYNKIPTKELDRILEKNNNTSKILTGIKSRGIGTLWDILNSKDLMQESKLKISNSQTLEYTENGYRVSTYKKSDREYKCQYCGDTNPSNFLSSSHITCKKCKNKLRRDKELNNLPTWLYNKSYKSARDRGLDFNLTEEYITQLLEQQNYLCYYTKQEFKEDKFNIPSVDRIDNSKGYIKGNVCICRGGVNICKNDVDMKEFKKMITDLYNNINNF